MEAVRLPVKNEGGYYEIRLESIGGLGANLCGKMLGELGITHLGLNSASFSSYGSEKTGTPVKAYIRYCEGEKEIRVHAPVVKPHLLAIFHDALLTDTSVWAGCNADTCVVVNTQFTPEQIWDKSISGKNMAEEIGRICCVPAQKIAMDTHSRINVVMLGAMAAASGFISLAAVKEACEKALGRKYPAALPANLEGIERGYRELQSMEPVKKQESSNTEIFSRGKQPQWGYDNAPIGGINPHVGNSIVSDVSASRQGYFPIFIQERCINCALCDSTCPDMVFQFEKGIYKNKEMMVNKGLDYYHCKGCLRCVAVCPTQALVKGVETEHPNKSYFLPNQDMLRKPDYYEKTGPDGYITSESYLTEQRIDGGEL